MNREKVLFSAIGSQDPFSVDGKDGAMLHIVSHYLPKKVYLYFTKEMLEKKDACETAIGGINATIEVKSNKQADIENAADFDAYHEVFSQEITRIREENPHADILLNVTSGTSQMTLALCAEVLSHKEVLFPIQVDNPMYNKNPNRCKEPGLLGLRKSVLKRQIKDMLTKWDYTGAYYLLKNSNVWFTARLEALLHHAYCRSVEQRDMAFQIAKNSLQNISNNLYPCLDEETRSVMDFDNVLALKRERGEITDFTLRAYAFSEFLLLNEEKMEVLLESISKLSKRGKREWDLVKAEQNHPMLIKKLRKKGHNFESGFNTFTLSKVARYGEISGYELLSNDEIRSFRNKTAHGMASITENMLRKHYNEGSMEIQTSIKTNIERIYNPPPESFEIFGYINNEITIELG